MERLLLDKIDFNILATLSRDCRISYNSLASQVGLTSKSVKARVKNMVRSGVIERFIVRVNPSGFNYRTARVLIRINNRITKDEVIRRVKQIGDLTFHVHHVGRTSVAAINVKGSLDEKTIQSLNDSLNPATIDRISVSELPVTINPSETDLSIIKCLVLSDARMEISEIAKEIHISEKTVTRRLDRMKEGHLLEFSIQCDPASMIGYVQFAILISVEKSHYRRVYEQMYIEFQENILYHPSTIDPDDQLIFVLFGENVFMMDIVLSNIYSFEGVKNAEIYILTKWHYYDDWIIREIDKALLSLRRRSLTHKSIKVASAYRNVI